MQVLALASSSGEFGLTQTYTKQEYELAALLTQSRQAYLQANTPSQKVAAMGEVHQAIERFRNYAAQNPQLRSSQAFINLQYESAGTENRIAVERMRYNPAVQYYNQKIQLFLNSRLARVFGFDTIHYQLWTPSFPKYYI